MDLGLMPPRVTSRAGTPAALQGSRTCPRPSSPGTTCPAWTQVCSSDAIFGSYYPAPLSNSSISKLSYMSRKITVTLKPCSVHIYSSFLSSAIPATETWDQQTLLWLRKRKGAHSSLRCPRGVQVLPVLHPKLFAFWPHTLTIESSNKLTF